jgi:hypothetical protein
MRGLSNRKKIVRFINSKTSTHRIIFIGTNRPAVVDGWTESTPKSLRRFFLFFVRVISGPRPILPFRLVSIFLIFPYALYYFPY